VFPNGCDVSHAETRLKHEPVYPETRRLFRALTDLLPDAAVFVVDRNRAIRFWSSGAERLLGFRVDEVVGEHCLKANRCTSCMQGCGLSTHGELRDVPLPSSDQTASKSRS
jgi:nitrogen fixation/metabolism regulation signal transduction histidine kinase